MIVNCYCYLFVIANVSLSKVKNIVIVVLQLLLLVLLLVAAGLLWWTPWPVWSSWSWRTSFLTWSFYRIKTEAGCCFSFNPVEYMIQVLLIMQFVLGVFDALLILDQFMLNEDHVNKTHLIW